MNPYHKIQTVFLRDPATNNKTLLMGRFAEPEFAYLAGNEWVFTEKVDGTNIRVMVDPNAAFIGYGGRTNDAQIPARLGSRLTERFQPLAEKLHEMFPDGACLYGEGYGASIQKAGGNYRPDVDFVLFDVRIGDFWLQREGVEDVASTLGIDVVPIIGRGTLNEMVVMAECGFSSRWGDFQAEGIVARPAVELQTRSGKRIITKIKHKDFAPHIAQSRQRRIQDST